MKTAGVPVEFNVATILVAIMALFPIPVMITRPLEFKMQVTASEKSLSIKEDRLAIAKLSMLMVCFAVCKIEL